MGMWWKQTRWCVHEWEHRIKQGQSQRLTKCVKCYTHIGKQGWGLMPNFCPSLVEVWQGLCQGLRIGIWIPPWCRDIRESSEHDRVTGWMPKCWNFRTSWDSLANIARVLQDVIQLNRSNLINSSMRISRVGAYTHQSHWWCLLSSSSKRRTEAFVSSMNTGSSMLWPWRTPIPFHWSQISSIRYLMPKWSISLN